MAKQEFWRLLANYFKFQSILLYVNVYIYIYIYIVGNPHLFSFDDCVEEAEQGDVVECPKHGQQVQLTQLVTLS